MYTSPVWGKIMWWTWNTTQTVQYCTLPWWAYKATLCFVIYIEYIEYIYIFNVSCLWFLSLSFVLTHKLKKKKKDIQRSRRGNFTSNFDYSGPKDHYRSHTASFNSGEQSILQHLFLWKILILHAAAKNMI